MQKRSRATAVVLAWSSILLVACVDRLPTTEESLPAIALDVVSGDMQQGIAGEELPAPLVVRVTTGSGKKPLGVANMPVDFVVTNGGGSLFAGSTVTDANGYASDYWTLGPRAGTDSVEARAVTGQSGTRRVFGMFSATGIAGAPKKLAFEDQPSNVPPSVTIPLLRVVMQDANGNAIVSPGAVDNITLAITNGTGRPDVVLSGTTMRPAENGVATFSDLTVDRVGTGYSLTATALTGLDSAISASFAVTGLVSIRVGSLSSCGATGGTAYCWGRGDDGRLGNGSTADSPIPVAVHGGLTFAAVSAGGSQTCGLTTSGAAYCWGLNVNGQLGNGSTTSSPTPVAVHGGLTFTAVSAGVNHTCGLTTSGAVYCWGLNVNGQLGDGSTTSSPTPVEVHGLSFAAVSAGGSHTCGMTTSGTAYCWGINLYGQLGNGSTVSSPTPFAVHGGLTFAAVSAGGTHTCGLTTSGWAYCWGRNQVGQLGNGSTEDSPIPVAVHGGYTLTAVSAGGIHTCGMMTSGTAYCWGLNVDGQLGNGSTSSSSVPVPLQGP